MNKSNQSPWQRIHQMGLIALLNAALPVDELLEMGDALLAAPVLVMALPLEHPEAFAALQALRQRFGRHLLIGGADPQNQTQASAAIVAGAQFLLLPQVNRPLLHQCQRHGILALPTVTSQEAASAAIHAGAAAVQMPLQVAGSAGTRKVLQQAMLPLLLVLNDVDEQNISQAATVGADAIRVETLKPGESWSAAALITQMRRLRQRWEAAKHGANVKRTMPKDAG